MRSFETTPFSRLLRKALLIFLLFGIAGLSSYGWYSWQREERDVRDNLLIFSSFLASASQAFFNEIGNGLEPLGEVLVQIDVLKNPESARSYLDKFQKRHPQVRAIALFAPDGAMLINTAVKPGDPLPDFRQHPPYIKQLREDMGSKSLYTVGPPEIGKAIKRWRFPVRHVVRDRNGNPKFLLQAAIPLEKEGTFLHQLPVPPNSYIGLLRADGYQQARFPVEEDISTYGRDSPNPVARMVRAQPGMQEGYFSGSSPWLAGELQRVVAFTKLSNLEMYAYVSVPAGYVAQRWWQHNLAVFISFVAFFGLFIAIAYLVTKREGLHSRELVE